VFCSRNLAISTLLDTPLVTLNNAPDYHANGLQTTTLTLVRYPIVWQPVSPMQC